MGLLRVCVIVISLKVRAYLVLALLRDGKGGDQIPPYKRVDLEHLEPLHKDKVGHDEDRCL